PLNVPKFSRAVTTAQRSAAQNAQNWAPRKKTRTLSPTCGFWAMTLNLPCSAAGATSGRFQPAGTAGVVPSVEPATTPWAAAAGVGGGVAVWQAVASNSDAAGPARAPSLNTRIRSKTPFPAWPIMLPRLQPVTHYSEWAVTQQYDAIIIGSGQAGGPLSTALARAGYRTALVEREHVGGTCINEGCTPTKTMVASARVAYLDRRAADYGIKTGPVEIDMIRVRQRKRDIVDSFRSSSERRITGTPGVDLLRGEARFVAPKTVRVDGDELTAERIFINTGARPSRPPIAGLDSVPSLDSTSIMELDTVPEHLIVLGGGYVGLEFGQMFRRFGSQVTIVQRGPRLLSREDGDVADAVADILRQDGVSVCLETDVLRVQPGIRVLVRSTAGERSVVGSHLLVAVGRTPNTDMLDLQATGLQPDKQGFLPANDRLETAVPGIYALGDVKGGPAFTHISYDDYRIIKTNLIDG